MPLRLQRFRAAGLAARPHILAALLLATSFSPVVAAEAAEPGIDLNAPWIRMIIPSRPAAGYLTLVNQSDQPHSLTGATSSGCAALMLHRSVSQGGVEQMAMVQSVLVQAHGSVALAPGGYHLMCMSPTPSLKPGTSVPVTLSFADGGSVTADFPVRNAIGK